MTANGVKDKGDKIEMSNDHSVKLNLHFDSVKYNTPLTLPLCDIRSAVLVPAESDRAAVLINVTCMF